MGNLYEAFTEKFEANCRQGGKLKDAFEKANQEMGFTAYKTYNSFLNVRRSKIKKK